MATKSKLAKEREAADRVAEMMYVALLKLPKEEQEAAVLAIKKITRNRRKADPSPR
jgi:hypothetical protein